jgi:WD40 repeat protein
MILFFLLATLQTQTEDLPEGATLRLGPPRLRPVPTVRSLAFLPDNRTVLVSDGASLVLVDAQTKTVSRKLSAGPYFPSSNAVVSPDGTLVALPDGRAAVAIVEIATGKELRQLAAPGGYAVQFLPDGKLLATTDPRAVTYWDPRTGKTEKVLEMKGMLQVVFAPGGKVAAGIVASRSLVLWDPATGEEKFRDTTAMVWSMSFSPDGGRLAVARGKSTQIWDVASKSKVLEWKNANDENTISWSPLGPVLACDSTAGIMLRDPATGKETGKIPERGRMAFSPDGKILAIGDRIVTFWNPATGANLHPDGSDLLRPLTAIAFVPDGGRLVSATDDASMVVWDLKTRAPLRTIKSTGTPVNRLGFMSDGRTLWTLNRDGDFRSWDIDTGKPGTILQGGPGQRPMRLSDFAPCPVGNSFATCTANQIQIWDGATGAELKKIPTPSGGGLAWLPDGKSLIFLYKGLLHLDAATGRELKSVQTFIPAHPLRVNSTGDRIAGGSWIWDMEPAHPPLNFGFGFIEFLPGGKTFVGATQKKFGVYDAISGETIQEREISPIVDAKIFALSPDRKSIASSDMDRTILIWDVPKRP